MNQEPPEGSRTPGREKAGIRLLSDAVIDQIAAGEVIERPASVVKELVENSLDADARRLRIEVRDGGAALIAVTDDGVGMSPADAQLALQRHATSKLRSAADLERIGSFGFRGEALPSIASVSRLRLRTRLRAGDARGEAHEIRVEAGRLVEEHAVGGPEGTRVEVADLFANVPARRKFLKRASTEWGHVADWVGRLALALPHVHFELQRDDRAPVVWPAVSDPLDRIAAVLSERDAAALVRAEYVEAGARLEAWVSAPEYTRPNTSGLYLFVNRRPVRDRLLRHALLDVYRDWLPRGRFPTAVVFLDLPPEAVDVNVHPAKWEVRFADPQLVHRVVRRAVRQAIEGRSWLGGEPAPPPRTGEPAASWDAGAAHGGGASSAAGQGDWVFAGQGEAASAGRETGESQASPDARLHFGELRLLGQLKATYLLVEGRSGLLLVDQHAAHERVLYERLRAEWIDRGVESQGLLTPLSLDLEAHAIAALVENADLVRKLGFELAPFGEKTVIVRALPALLAGRDAGELVRGLAQDLTRGDAAVAADADSTRMLEAADRMFASLACHAARRAGDRIVEVEQRALLQALDEIPWAPTCPHGRPVAVALDVPEIERRFGRR